MFPLIVESSFLAYFFALFPPTSTWQQSITSDGSSELRVKVLDYGGDECHNRNGGPEGVMGIMNTRNSDQIKAMAFWDIASCDRTDPERYSLFIHWYDLPAAVQLLDLGLPGLEHRWKSFRRIVPNSPTWINFRNTAKGKYIPGPDGMTPIGNFFAELIQKTPPGSIRYRIMGTNEYITVKDAVYVPKTISAGKPLIDDKVLSAEEMTEAREALRGQVSSWFYATGGVPMHILQTKDYIFQERVSRAYVQAAEPPNFGKVKNPGVVVVKQMLGEYRYPKGDDSMKAEVDAANNERERIEKLQHEAQAKKYIKYLQRDQKENYEKYLAARGGNGDPQNQGQPIVYPLQFYGEIIGVNQTQLDDIMGTDSQPQSNLTQNQVPAGSIGQSRTEGTVTSNLMNSMKWDPLKELGSNFGSFAPSEYEPQTGTSMNMGTQSQDYFLRQLMAPKISQTYTDLDRDPIDVLDQQYLRQREALKSKSLSELDWEFGNVDPWARFRVPNLGSQSFDLGFTNQNQGAPLGSELPVSSLGELGGEEVLFNEILAADQQQIQENDQSRFEEEKMREIDEYDW
ncbi:hypothetical protein TWF718_000216 [Orbilia javanica]|uniref:Uncharacterized protein n=1 Tax=Orbilia javanica TaxID=47235 RepID=A0AAN8N7P6_9PEZI